MPCWAGGVSERPINRTDLVLGLIGSLVAAVLNWVLLFTSGGVFVRKMWAMLGFPHFSLLNGLATGLRLVRLVLLVPAAHPVEQEGEGELAIVIGVAHRLCGRFSSSFAFGFGFCSLSLSIACGKLVLEGFYEDLEIKALINVDFCSAF